MYKIFYDFGWILNILLKFSKNFNLWKFPLSYSGTVLKHFIQFTQFIDFIKSSREFSAAISVAIELEEHQKHTE